MASRIGSDGESGSVGKMGQSETALAAAAESATARLLEISDRIRQALECPVCLDLNTDPMCFCTNGHALCTECYIKLEASNMTNGCPLCRSPLSTTTGGPLTALRLVLTLPLVSVACMYWRNGCRTMMCVRAIAGHEAGCDHNPFVRCLVATCPWLGTYGLLYDHVCTKHPEAIVSTKGNRLMVTDANTIKENKRRVYLVTADRGSTLMWVLMSRTTRTYMQMGVFMVDSRQRSPQEQEHQEQRTGHGNAWSTDMGYRLTYADAEGRCKERSQTRWVGRWLSSMACAEDSDLLDDAGSFTTFKPRTGRVEVHWFKHTTGRCKRFPDSCVWVMDVARPP